MKIIVLSSHTPSLFWFRLDMMKKFIELGHEVLAVGNEPEKDWTQKLSKHGIRYQSIPVKRNGTNPVEDLKTYHALKTLFKREQPDRLFVFQAKTVIYGSLAAHAVGNIRIYPLIAGIGSLFLHSSLKTRILRTIMAAEYRAALKHADAAFFQNNDDVELFREFNMLGSAPIVFLKGSGVNTDYFEKQPLPETPGLLFVGRLLRDKGVFEYLEACKAIKSVNPDIRCMLVGPFDSNPTSLTSSQLQEYIDAGIIEYFGEQSDVRPYLEKCSIFILPSYREGTPKAVLEAMSCGKAVITTDAPGCRETVQDGINGYLVSTHDIGNIVKHVLFLADHPDVVQSMAERSREISENIFDVNKVNAVIAETMEL